MAGLTDVSEWNKFDKNFLKSKLGFGYADLIRWKKVYSKYASQEKYEQKIDVNSQKRSASTQRNVSKMGNVSVVHIPEVIFYIFCFRMLV